MKISLLTLCSCFTHGEALVRPRATYEVKAPAIRQALSADRYVLPIGSQRGHVLDIPQALPAAEGGEVVAQADAGEQTFHFFRVPATEDNVVHIISQIAAGPGWSRLPGISGKACGIVRILPGLVGLLMDNLHLRTGVVSGGTPSGG